MQTSVTSCSSLAVCVGVVAWSDLVFFLFRHYFSFLLVFAAIYLSVCQFLSISSFLLSSPTKISPFSLWLLTLCYNFLCYYFKKLVLPQKETSDNRNLDRYHHQQHNSLFFVFKKCQNYMTKTRLYQHRHERNNFRSRIKAAPTSADNIFPLHPHHHHHHHHRAQQQKRGSREAGIALRGFSITLKPHFYAAFP